MGAAGAIVAAQATISAASAFQQSKAAATQAQITKTEANISHAQQEFELARTAAIESEQFRRDLATTVASASGRGGAGMARQFGGQASSAYLHDIEAINRAYKINDIQKQNKIAQANALKASTSINSIVDLGKNILGAGATYVGGLGKSSTPAVPSIPKAPTALEATSMAPTSLSLYEPNVPYAPAAEYSGTKSGKFNPLG